MRIQTCAASVACLVLVVLAASGCGGSTALSPQEMCELKGGCPSVWHITARWCVGGAQNGSHDCGGVGKGNDCDGITFKCFGIYVTDEFKQMCWNSRKSPYTPCTPVLDECGQWQDCYCDLLKKKCETGDGDTYTYNKPEE